MARFIITLYTPLCFFLFSLLSYQTVSQPQHLQTFCNPFENFTQTSPYETNRNVLLSTLRESSSLGTYANATTGLIPDIIHGMFLCRGDITTESCAVCVQTAISEITTNCSTNKAAVIYYEECMVRYSNFPFFSKLEITPGIVFYSLDPAPNSSRFNQTLLSKFNKLILNVSSSTLIPYFLEDQERVTQPEGVYELESMVQCSPDLDPSNCTACLTIAVLRVSTCCGLPSFAQIFTPKCLLRYNTTILSSPSPSPPPLSLPPQASPPQSSPPPSLSQSPQAPPPLVFTRPNVPNPSGAFSVNVIKGNEILGRIVIAMVALMFALVEV